MGLLIRDPVRDHPMDSTKRNNEVYSAFSPPSPGKGEEGGPGSKGTWPLEVTGRKLHSYTGFPITLLETKFPSKEAKAVAGQRTHTHTQTAHKQCTFYSNDNSEEGNTSQGESSRAHGWAMLSKGA